MRNEGKDAAMKRKAIVFDMDGVLFDTEVLCMKSWMAVAEANGLPDMEKVFPKCIGCNANDSRRFVLEAYGEDFDYAGFRAQASEWFWDDIQKNGLPVKTGVRELLEWLKREGWIIGLASSTKLSSVLKHLNQAGIREYFSAVVTGDMVEHSKPLPDIYFLACRELGAEPAETYAVEDSPNGIRAAHGAGMLPLMVPDMVSPDEEMRTLSTAVFRDLTEVLDYLREKTESK